MKNILFLIIPLVGLLLTGCQKQADSWVGFYYPEGTPQVGEAVCEIQEFQKEATCENWGKTKSQEKNGAEYYCGYRCSYDSSCQYACMDHPENVSVSSQEKQIYTHEIYNYTLQYPKDWKAQHEYYEDKAHGVFVESNVFTSPSGELELRFGIVESEKYNNPDGGIFTPSFRTGMGAGELADAQNSIVINEKVRDCQSLVYQEKVKGMYCSNMNIGSYTGGVQIEPLYDADVLSYEEIDMSERKELEQALSILKSFQFIR